MKSLGLEFKDGTASEALGHYTGLDKCYKGADDNTKGAIRSLHYDLGQKWSAESALEWSKKYLKEKDKDSVIISSKDLADKEEALNKLADENATAKTTSANMLKAVKKALATQIVMYKSLTGNADYKDLDKAALAAKVEELSKRHVTSLQDAVADIMAELKWVETPPVQPNPATVNEPGKPVADNAQVDKSVTVNDSAVSTPAAETEAEKLSKQQALDQALRDRLAPMSPRERRIYLDSLAYNDAKAATKK